MHFYILYSVALIVLYVEQGVNFMQQVLKIEKKKHE